MMQFSSKKRTTQGHLPSTARRYFPWSTGSILYQTHYDGGRKGRPKPKARPGHLSDAGGTRDFEEGSTCLESLLASRPLRSQDPEVPALKSIQPGPSFMKGQALGSTPPCHKAGDGQRSPSREGEVSKDTVLFPWGSVGSPWKMELIRPTHSAPKDTCNFMARWPQRC